MNYTTSSNERLAQLNNSKSSEHLPAMIIMAVMALVGFVGNTLVFLVYVLSFRPTTTKYFVIAMALFDLLNCIIGIPLRIVRFHYYYSTSLVVCKLAIGSGTLSSMASAAVLLVVAVDRYKKICRPLQKQINTKTAIIACCVSTFLVGIFTTFPVYVFGYESVVYTPSAINVTLCGVRESYAGARFLLIYTIIQIFIFFGATTAIIILYSFIWRQILRQSRFRKRMYRHSRQNLVRVQDGDPNEITLQAIDSSGEGTSANDGKVLKATPPVDNATTSAATGGAQDKTQTTSLKADKAVRRMTKMLFLITLVFIISFLPYLLITALFSLGTFQNVSLGVHQMIFVLQSSYCIQSMANPFIYSFFSQQFRTELRNLLKNVRSRGCKSWT